MAELIVENLSKTYGDTPIIQDFDFYIKPKEIVALVGKSGTGKTTFLRILTRLEQADRGTIAIGDRFLCQADSKGDSQYVSKSLREEYASQIGLVFQDFQLFPNLTVMENCLEALLSKKNNTKEEMIKKAENLLDRMGIQDKKDMYPKMLSGGQKQRVAIVRSLLLEPLFLCFDEPTSALDKDSAADVGEVMKSIAEQGTGVLVITHDLGFAEAFSTRMVSSDTFLNNSKILSKEV